MSPRRHWGKNAPACGQNGVALLLTEDVAQVTCKRCLRLHIGERAMALGMKWGWLNEHERGWVPR